MIYNLLKLHFLDFFYDHLYPLKDNTIKVIDLGISNLIMNSLKGKFIKRNYVKKIITLNRRKFVWTNGGTVFMTSISELEKMRDEHDIPNIMNALDVTEDKKSREKAAYILGDIRAEEAVEPLISMLDDDYWPIRKAATLSLGRIGDKRAVEPLINVLKDDHWHVRETAALALGALGDKRAVEPIITALKDGSLNVKCEVVDALGVLGDNRALKPLMDILREDDYILRACTVTSLGKIGDNMAVNALLNSLEDENYFVRVNAANALATIGDEGALPALQEALDNSKGESKEFERAVKGAMNEIRARTKKKS